MNGLKKNLIKVCDIIKNIDDSKPLWDILWVGNVSNDILTQNNGRCYFLVVSGEIYKIGYSDCKGGIKSTINSYKSSGNSGRPSDRTHGVHLLIALELLKGKKVEVYFTYNDNVTIEYKDMFGNIHTETTYISGKVLESKNIEIYKNMYGNYPIWNLQERNVSWPTFIQDSRKRLLEGQSMTIDTLEKHINYNLLTH
jgi:hypothetical protein